MQKQKPQPTVRKRINGRLANLPPKYLPRTPYLSDTPQYKAKEHKRP
jgi:hypothetical protein